VQIYFLEKCNMTTEIFNIFSPNSKLLPHKDARIERLATQYQITYQGELNSAGFRVAIKTEPGVTYQIEVNAHLITGDKAFIYCETNNQRLLERKYFLTAETTEYKLTFNSNSHNTYVGILFYNSNQAYTMLIDRFIISEVKKRKLTDIIHHNGQIVAQEFLEETPPDLVRLLIKFMILTWKQDIYVLGEQKFQNNPNLEDQIYQWVQRSLQDQSAIDFMQKLIH